MIISWHSFHARNRAKWSPKALKEALRKNNLPVGRGPCNKQIVGNVSDCRCVPRRFVQAGNNVRLEPRDTHSPVVNRASILASSSEHRVFAFLRAYITLRVARPSFVVLGWVRAHFHQAHQMQSTNVENRYQGARAARTISESCN